MSNATFLDVDGAAEFLGIRKSYLYKLLHERKIPFYKPTGGHVLFDQGELEAFIRKGRVSTNEELSEKAIGILNNRGA